MGDTSQELLEYIRDLLQEAEREFKGGDPSGIARDATIYDETILTNFADSAFVIRVELM